MIEWQAKKSDCRDAQCTESTIGSKVIWQILNVGEHSTFFFKQLWSMPTTVVVSSLNMVSEELNCLLVGFDEW